MPGNCSKYPILNAVALCRQFSDLLEERRESVLEILVELEPYIWAQDEIDRSINCLLNIKAQARYIDGVVLRRACTYLPVNQPLYAFVLNAFLLKLVSQNVYYRPPEKQRALHQNLHQLFSDVFEGIEICCISRNEFFENFVRNSEVVVFTGKYENARLLLSQLAQESLMIYNGSALNPIIVSPSANLSQSVISTINARLYNSGQDCMAPAGILVHESILPWFTQELIRELKTVPVGENREKKVIVGPMVSDSCTEENRALIKKYKNTILFGGEEISSKLFTPAVFLLESRKFDHQIITYAPFFFIQTYRTIQDIAGYLSTPTARFYKGYVSIFGDVSEANAINKLDLDLNVLRNCTLFDYENGNVEFGGYGEGCSFVSANHKIIAKPILLLREVQDWFFSKS